MNAMAGDRKQGQSKRLLGLGVHFPSAKGILGAVMEAKASKMVLIAEAEYLEG